MGMTRSLETALAIFPRKKVYQIPFMNDKEFYGHHDANMPRTQELQRQYFRSQNVDWQFMPSDDLFLKDLRLNKKLNKRHWTPNEARAASTYRGFRAQVGEVVL